MQVYLIKLLEDKLKYLRNYKGKQPTNKELSDTVVATTKVPKTQQGPRPPIINLEDDDYDEDEPAFERHLKFFQREYKKLRPDEYIFKDMMKKTFKMQRQKIQDAPMRVADLLQMYPALQSYDHVSVALTICLHN